MKIQLNSLTLTNFKGVRSLTIPFDDYTTISGDNATGKTTIFDSFCWVLFGKDSNDRKDFNIKTLDESGNAIPQIDHEVEAHLLIDDVPAVIKRTYREKWTRRRGSEDAELTGHETTFLWNEVPLQANEYKSKIDALVSEGLFKLLTSALYFNQLPWEKRRSALIQIAGEITNSDVYAKMDKAHIAEITAILNQGKDIVEFKKEVSAKKKTLNDALKILPARIDEVMRSIPDPVNAVQIESDLQEKRKALLTVENTMQSEIEAYNEKNREIQGIQQQVHTLKSKLQTVEFNAKQQWQSEEYERSSKVNTVKREIQENEDKINSTKNRIALLTLNITNANNQIDELRARWNKVSEESLNFKEGEFVCPACKRELDPLTIDERKNTMIADFEKAKSVRLTAITAEGKPLSSSIQRMEEEITELRTTIATLQASSLPSAPEYTPSTFTFVPSEEYLSIKSQIESMELQVLEVPSIDVNGLKLQKMTIQNEIDDLKKQLTIQEQIDRGNKRKVELMAEESSLAQQIADLEKKEFALESFQRNRMDMVEKRVNDKFSIVKFRMFDTQINGGVIECCDAMVGGVPYADVNSAGKIKAGIDIINTLSEHYGHYLPIFVDNSETINVIPKTKSQLIALYVTKDKQLTINNQITWKIPYPPSL